MPTFVRSQQSRALQPHICLDQAAHGTFSFWLSRIPAAASGYTGTPHCRRQSRAGQVPNPGGEHLAKQLLRNFVLLLSMRVPVFPHVGGARFACISGETEWMARGCFMFMFALFAEQIFGFSTQLLHGCVFQHVYRCSSPMQPHHAKRREKAHESLLRERQIFECPQVFASFLRKLKSDGTGQCLYLVRYCSQTTRKFARVILPAWAGRRCLPRSSMGMFVDFYFFRVSESQCLQWSHLAKSLGQAVNFEVHPTITTATTTQLPFLR